MHFLPPESVCRAQSVTAWMWIKRQTGDDAPDEAKPNGNEADDEDGRFGIRRTPVEPVEALGRHRWADAADRPANVACHPLRDDVPFRARMAMRRREVDYAVSAGIVKKIAR
ncbi:hypothetical protein [Pandoraea faecigallinarum]|uniref:hypothetical protein n=1 Tax=Pandoraea faecigallinarum TaxID=656179 RepID=UPI0012F4840D|nr:hypothetical protein [Pandoraea faecigallinarum]